MIGFALRNWKLVLDCLIVIAIILAFTYFDPFSIFNTTKLRNTATLVTGVREIGELVTTEYYGEVISSWKEFKLKKYPSDSIQDYADDFFRKIKANLSDIGFNDGLKNQNAFKSKLNKQESAIYDKFIAFLGTHYTNKKIKKLYKNETLNEKAENRIMAEIHEELEDYYKSLKKRGKRDNTFDFEQQYKDYLDSIPEFIDGFYPFYSMLVDKDANTRENKKKNIVFIGRGWGKAGFRFNKFDENNFFYDRNTKTVHFYDLEPAILDTDINPWFIPERKVKGFELVSYSGEVTFQDAKAVKRQCKELLLQQAGIEILQRARENGEEALKHFFSLVLGEPDLKVTFQKLPYGDVYAHIAADTLVTVREALTIDTLYRNELEEIKKVTSPDEQRQELQLLGQFINKTKKLKFLTDDYTFNFYSLQVAKMLADTFHVDTTDLKKMIALRDTLRISKDSSRLTTNTLENNPIWFQQGDFIQEFNSTLPALLKESTFIAGMQSTKDKFIKTDTGWTFQSKPVLPIDSIDTSNGRVRFFFYQDDLVNKPIYPSDFAYGIVDAKPSKEAVDSLQKDSVKKIFNKDLTALRSAERPLIIKFQSGRIKHEDAVAPVKSFAERIRELKSKIALP